MRCNKQRYTDFVKAFEKLHDLKRKFGVEVACRFVGYEERWTGYYSPGDTDTLLFTAGQCYGRLLFLSQQSHLVQCGADTSPGLSMANSLNHEGQRDVVVYGPVVQEFVILKHHSDIAAKTGNASSPDTIRVLSIDNHLSASRSFDQRDQLEQGTLAGAGMAGQKDNLTFLDVKADFRERFAATRIALGHVFKSNHD